MQFFTAQWTKSQSLFLSHLPIVRQENMPLTFKDKRLLFCEDGEGSFIEE